MARPKVREWEGDSIPKEGRRCEDRMRTECKLGFYKKAANSSYVTCYRLNCVPKMVSWGQNPVPKDVTLFGNSIIVAGIREIGGDHPGIEWAPSPR